MRAILLVVFTSALGVLGDFFFKLAGREPGMTNFKLIAVGVLCFASTLGGIFLALKLMKLSTFGAVYSVTTILLLVAVGVFYFHEKLNVFEMLGVAAALVSVVLLSRFA